MSKELNNIKIPDPVSRFLRENGLMVVSAKTIQQLMEKRDACLDFAGEDDLLKGRTQATHFILTEMLENVAMDNGLGSAAKLEQTLKQ